MLAGCSVPLLAQRLAPFEAACLRGCTPPPVTPWPAGRGTAASDLIPVIRQLFEEQSPCLK